MQEKKIIENFCYMIYCSWKKTRIFLLSLTLAQDLNSVIETTPNVYWNYCEGKK